MKTNMRLNIEYYSINFVKFVKKYNKIYKMNYN